MRVSAAALALCFAGCGTLPADKTVESRVILPGYLDLPLAPDHGLLETSTDAAVFPDEDEFASAERDYVKALLSMGWTELSPSGLLKTGEGAEARCIDLGQKALVVGPKIWLGILFMKTNCPAPQNAERQN